MAKYARVGEKVKVVIPKQFIRCGYPLTIKAIMDRDCEEIERDVVRMFAALENRPAPPPIPSEDTWALSLEVSEVPAMSATVHGMLASAVAAYRLENENFGGKERSIFETEDGPFGKDQEWTVIGKSFVKTGTRYPSHYYFDSYTGEGDYEPGGLANEKTHCVYTVKRFDRKYKILAANCEKI